MKPYPIFLIGLEQRHCIMIGGGREGEHKVKALLECEATVTVISPELTPTLTEWAENGRFTWINRAYQTGDLRGAFLVIAERSNAATNTAIWEEAEAESVLVNVMDDVDHCNFVAGSVVRQGQLVISISTSGAAPALSVRLRERFEQEFGPEYGTFLEWMKAMRPPMAESHKKFMDRRRRWYEIVDSEVLDLIRNGRYDEAQQLIQTISEIDPLPRALSERV